MSDASLQAGSRGDELEAIIEEVIACEPVDQRALDRILRRHPKRGRGLYSKREILSAFRDRGGEEGRGLGELAFAEKLRTCPTRSVSGVTPVAVMTRPFPCPGRCIFCPDDDRMPKSYLADEPGCQRAAANRFDPYLQTWNRLLAYRRMGHPTAKIERLRCGAGRKGPGRRAHRPRRAVALGSPRGGAVRQRVGPEPLCRSRRRDAAGPRE
jgi:histone acetyltransferase (RNA polymerase elongator complex component)